ncbi:hypothetical protein F4778DRAFT_779498 [Xylariomycetidae sp. FL2044]|nr:hypothetical protein F4778DRAFT_779498 [Xylariomycetidae sp. FL2044]
MKPGKRSYPNLTNDAHCIKSHFCKFHPDDKKYLVYLAGGEVKATTNESAYMLFMKAEDSVNWLCRFCKKTFESHSKCDHHARVDHKFKTWIVDGNNVRVQQDEPSVKQDSNL